MNHFLYFQIFSKKYGEEKKSFGFMESVKFYCTDTNLHLPVNNWVGILISVHDLLKMYYLNIKR